MIDVAEITTDEPSEFWAGKASAAFVVAEHVKVRRKLTEALTALLEAVKAEPAMNKGREHIGLGIQVNDALQAARSMPSAWDCIGRKQSLPERGECCWPVCGCDPQANAVIDALEESGDLVIHKSYRMRAALSSS